MRTSFDGGGTGSAPGTPSRRRRSTPVSRKDTQRVVQFTPLRQALDSRVQRRIGRMGLSNEINHIEREKRDAASYEKKLRFLLQERELLRQELETAKNSGASDGDQSPAQEELSLEASKNIEDLEAETSRLRQKISFSSAQDTNAQSELTNGDTIILDDTGMDGDTVFLSDSPDIRGVEYQPTIPDGFSLLENTAPGVDSSIQAQLPDYHQEAELRRLKLDLEAARKEKKNLFDAWHANVTSLDDTASANNLRQSSPPPDFFDRIVPTLTSALARASDATSSLESAKQELSTFGFSGSSTGEILSEMSSRFRTARSELERAVPGETGLHDGKSTLGALVKRVESLVKDLSNERADHDGALGREQALRGQFNELSVRYETATKKAQDLEISAKDMLHMRMRMREMEQEGEKKDFGIQRLNAALEQYREDVKNLEALVSSLEEENTASKNQHIQQASKLESKLSGEEKARRAAESKVERRDTYIRELSQTIEHNRIRTCDLMASIESLTKERQSASDEITILKRESARQLQNHRQEIERLEKGHQSVITGLEQKTAEQRQHHEQEIGTMNVRISGLNTALEGAQAEAEKLGHSNAVLEEQLQLEVEERDNLINRWVADQERSFAMMKETANAERRKAKVRSSNYELLKTKELRSDSSVTGSEPITPVSMSRHVNIDIGRGKHRRPMDSGVGILTDDLDDEPSGFNSDILSSDPAYL